MPSAFRRLVSSDWNECLAPCGPFDVITFHHPQLQADLEVVFRQYTGNVITLAAAVQRIQTLLPGPITREQMDAYLEQDFQTYRNVPQLIQACLERNILFMINTTGMIGYFQRLLARALLPPLPALSAHPLVRYTAGRVDPPLVYELRRIGDKPVHTEMAARQYGIPRRDIVIIGDSGGDGPHFAWGAKVGARLVGSMIKPSLARYCAQQGITIDHRFGHTYTEGQAKAAEAEMGYDFMALLEIIDQA